MIHAILICFENEMQTRQRYDRDVAPALELAGREFGLDTARTIADNSAERSDSLNAYFGTAYRFMGGNTLYGGGINHAVRRLPSAFVLYVCSRHGRAIDPTWAIDLIRPMVDDPAVGMTGCLWGSNSPEGVAHDTGQEWVKERFRFTHADGTGHVPQHIQGGVFAARTELLLRLPYPEGISHLYSDHFITWAAMKAGYKCVDVPSVRSVWRDVWPAHKMAGVKYIHDEFDP